MKILNRILAISAILAAPNAFSGVPVTSFRCDSPARDWRHSSLTGNGTLGAMVEGHVADEVIHLSHSRIYMPMDPELDNGARDPFMAACDLKISTDIDSWSDYRRRTIFRTGEVIVDAKDGEGRLYRRHVFASRPDGVIAIKIDDAAEREVFFALDALPISGFREARIFETGVRRFEVGKRDGFLFYRCEFSNRNPWNDLSGYVVALAAGEGKKEAFVAIEPVIKDSIASDPFPSMRKRLSAAVAAGYDLLLSRHVPVMDGLFSRVSLGLDCDDPRIARYFSAGRYNIISSTGDDHVPNLQGLWAASWCEPWGEVYKESGHLQCATAFYNRGNMTEFNEVLLKWMERKAKDPRHAHQRTGRLPYRLLDGYRHTLDADWLKRIDGMVKEYGERAPLSADNPAALLDVLFEDRPADFVTNSTLIAVARAAVAKGLSDEAAATNKALDYVRLGLVACKLLDAESAEKCLAHLTDGYWTDGGGSFHARGSAFNMDASGGYPYLITEMIVHGEEEGLRFFPAKPKSWRSGKVKGLLLRGAVKLEDLSWNGDDWRALLRMHDGKLLKLSRKEVPDNVYYYDRHAVQSDD
jgi:hypothetical protein